MKKFFTVFFISLGVIFTLIILFISYLFIFDPFNIKPLFLGTSSGIEIPKTSNTTPKQNTTSTSTPTPIVLSDTQKNTLTNLGVDPTIVPSTITSTQEACFRTQLGDARVEEILAGASPSITEVLSAKSCI